MCRLNKNIECNDENCVNIDLEGKCYLDPNFICICKLEQKLEELINDNSINVTNPSNTYEYINVIPVDRLYEFINELKW